LKNDESLFHWGIPGWCFIVLCVSLFVADYFVSPSSFSSKAIVGFLQNAQPNRSGTILSIEAVVAAGGVGIPIGFVLYQIYYCCFWKFFFRPERWFTQDVFSPESAEKLALQHGMKREDDTRIRSSFDFLARILFNIAKLSRLITWNDRWFRDERKKEQQGSALLFDLESIKSRLTEIEISKRVWTFLRTKLEMELYKKDKARVEESFKSLTRKFHTLGTTTFAFAGAFLVLWLTKAGDITYLYIQIYRQSNITDSIVITLVPLGIMFLEWKTLLRVGHYIYEKQATTAITGVFIITGIFLALIEMTSLMVLTEFAGSLFILIVFLFVSVCIYILRNNRRDIRIRMNTLMLRVFEDIDQRESQTSEKPPLLVDQMIQENSSQRAYFNEYY
jgi:hypothetical protein